MLASYQNWVSWTYHNLDLQLDLPCTKTKTDIWLFPIGHHTISLSLAYRRTEEKYNIPWNILLISIFLESFIWLYKSQSGDAARESKMLFFLGQEMSFMVKLQGIGIIFPFTAQPGRVLFSTHNLASGKPSLPISHKKRNRVRMAKSILVFVVTRSCAALRAADLGWSGQEMGEGGQGRNK